MTRKLPWLGLAGLIALLAAAACGDDPKQPKPAQACDDVVCDTEHGMACDPVDGLCKCGGPGGLVCGEDQTCVVDPSPACVSNACDLQTCERGQSCDPTDGECKCGNTACAADEECVQGITCVKGRLCEGVTCGEGETCDAADGQCKCGSVNPVLCSFGETCQNDTCTPDACAGVNCGAGMECNPADGLCHCGSEAGPVCSSGQSCVTDDTGSRCDGVDVCADAANRCFGGTVCDPTDPAGSCRCGGIGPTAPVCAPDQTCTSSGICAGGDKCLNVACTNGTSCDPEDGACKCGGVGGLTCAANQLCVLANNNAACANGCDALSPTACGAGEGCYFDASQRDFGSFCALAGVTGEGGTCTAPTDCAAGLHCTAGTPNNKCLKYCDAAANTGCNANQACVQVPNAPAGLGTCRQLAN